MKINVWYDDLNAAEALTLVRALVEFEIQRGDPQAAQLSTRVPEMPASEAPPEPPKRGRPRKEAMAAPDTAAPAPAVTREDLLVKLREAVKVKYEACEAWLDKRGKDSFMVLSDAELSAAVAELSR